MGFYRDHILPRGVNLALAGKEHTRLRARVAGGLSGRVLEVGFGSGLNLPHMPPAVTQLYAVDPATVGRKLARTRLEAFHAPVEFVGLDGETLPLDDASVDAVLSTWTLCSIPDPARALAEIRRVLVPGGALHFLEHGLSDDPKVARWQHRLDPLQRFVCGGCRLVLPVDELIRDAGLSVEGLATYYIKGPKPACAMYEGRGRRPD
ncbi:MAG: class I SAM-dependent methyltransferase [Planctomycetota bacterium]|jgi:SAM-dependent methyltransferase